MTLELPPDLARILREAPELRRAYVVGGSVRDALLGQPGTDFDFEVFGVGFEELATGLRSYGRVDVVGRSFGVAKLSLAGAIHDFSVPRGPSRPLPGPPAPGTAAPAEASPRAAAARRDYTLNALMWDPRTGELLDFFGGERDLRNRVLRHTGPSFAEDPLRVLRGMQFASRFDLVAAPETVALCRRLVDTYQDLAIERIREEWFKWATRAARPSAGLRFLEESGWLRHYPELQALRGVPQDPEWHPEGDVLDHTGHCLDALVELPEWRAASSSDRAVTTLAVLTHDLGKAVATREVERDGRRRIVSPGHDRIGMPLAEAFLRRIRAPRYLMERVPPLVGNHMVHLEEISERAVRRLARRLRPETVEHLCLVMTADAFGRPPRPRVVPTGVETLDRIARDRTRAHAQPIPPPEEPD